MTDVFNIIFDMFGNVIGWLKQIPITQNVSLFDFSVAILIMSIVIVAFVPVVTVGSTNYVNDTLRAEREEKNAALRAELETKRESDRKARQIESREYGLMSRSQKRRYLNNMKNK